MSSLPLPATRPPELVETKWHWRVTVTCSPKTDTYVQTYVFDDRPTREAFLLVAGRFTQPPCWDEVAPVLLANDWPYPTNAKNAATARVALFNEAGTYLGDVVSEKEKVFSVSPSYLPRMSVSCIEVARVAREVCRDDDTRRERLITQVYDREHYFRERFSTLERIEDWQHPTSVAERAAIYRHFMLNLLDTPQGEA